jgi:hypothetical protein
MKKRLLYRFALALLVFFGGCMRPGNGQESTTPEPVAEEAFDLEGEDFDPLELAFDLEVLGAPLNWDSLSDVDGRYLLALWEREPDMAKQALGEGAQANLDCGYGCTTLMLAAATGDQELVDAVRADGGQETPGAEPYLEILRFAERAQSHEFEECLERIAALTGQGPAAGDRPGLYRLNLDAESAWRLVQEHHLTLLEQGCYVFLYEQNYGIGDRDDEIWILPTDNKFAVMAFTGVQGINWGIENHLILHWMQQLDRDASYILTGCGFDFLSGHFEEPLRDAGAMAKRMFAFCPDIVYQGTGTVDDLAAELEASNDLFFWWD